MASSGNNGKTKTTELSTCEPALSKGDSHQVELTREASEDSQSVQTPVLIGSSEMQQGHFLQGGIYPQSMLLPGKISLDMIA